MKIIENKSFAFAFECEICHSKLEAEENDVRARYKGRSGMTVPVDRAYNYYVVCAVCGNEEKVPFAHTTPRIRECARNKYYAATATSWD